MMQYSDSYEQCAQFLRLVIPFLAKHKLAANPIAYTIGYEYVARSNKSIRKAVDDRLEQGQSLTDEFINSLFATHINGGDEEKLLRMNQDIRRVINNLFDSTSLADEKAAQFSQSLIHHGHELEGNQEGQETEKVIQKLLADTHTMQAVTSDMQTQLDESKHEINLLRTQLEEVREESLTDALTGLTNRKGFSRKIEQAFPNQDTANDRRCILMVDIDHFKRVNDTYGHLVGDKVIQFVATTLKKQVKGKDTVARFGGEEYVVLLPETSLAGAHSVAENIRTAIEKTRIKRMDTGEPIGQVTVSIGVAQYLNGESIDELLGRADSALYESKENGRNRVTVDKTETIPQQESLA